MNGPDLKAAREALGLSQEAFGKLVEAKGTDRAVRRWESGTHRIPGPVAVLVRHALASPDLRERMGLPKNLVSYAGKGRGE
jgi:DNA-binding transcriptional regulator YiaG